MKSEGKKSNPWKTGSGRDDSTKGTPKSALKGGKKGSK